MTEAWSNELVAYVDLVVRFVARQLLDPHRYFEQKLLGQLAECADDTARVALLGRISGWLDTESLLTPGQRKQLDARLAARCWPSTELAARDPGLTAVLLRGPQDAYQLDRLRQADVDGPLSDADRDVVRACLERSGA
jgi:hypothetical protein